MEIQNKIDKLKQYILKDNTYSVYDYDDVTLNELLSKFFTKINGCIDVTNATIELTEYLVSIGIPNEILSSLNVMVKDGTFEKLINDNLFNSLDSKINNKANVSDLEVEKNRIDNLISFGNGVDNAETLDIRVGANGLTYDSAGSSVRSQIKDLNDIITEGVNDGYKGNFSIQSTFESGGINFEGSLISDNRYIRTRTFLNSNIKKVVVADKTYCFLVVKYNKLENFIDRILDLESYTDFDFSNYKYKIVLYKKDNSSNIDNSHFTKVKFYTDEIKILDSIETFIKPKSITHDQTSFIKQSKNMIIGKVYDNKYVSWQDGSLVDNLAYNSTDFIKVEPNTRISLNRHNALAFYDINKKYLCGINGSGTNGNKYNISPGEIEGQDLHATYTVPTNVYYIRITLNKKFKDQQLEIGEVSTEYEKGCYYIEDFHYPISVNDVPLFKNKFTKIGDVCTISTKKAKYTFKRVEDSSINVNAWRLYEGRLIDEDNNEYTMWVNSDAEGAIKIIGEEDFVCGYHGDEHFDSIDIIVNGIPLDISKDYDIEFDDLTIVSKSKVYHCNTSQNKGVQAFNRVKTLNFKGDKVTIANRFEVLKDLTIERGALMLFQCYKSQGDNVIINKFSNNNDLIIYDVPDEEGVMPLSSKKMTQVKFYTNFGVIDVKATKGFDNEKYKGYITNFGSQNRLKIYFDYINTTTEVVTGDILECEFEFNIY